MLTKKELEQVTELNDAVKDLDPMLKTRMIHIGLLRIFKDDYQNILDLLQQPELKSQTIDNGSARDTSLQESLQVPTVKQFFDEKKPSSSSEIVTVFGYYLEHYKKLQEFSETEIAQCYSDARERKPKFIGQALRDAKNKKGYLIEARKKGTFRLSNSGENLVIHDLPNK